MAKQKNKAKKTKVSYFKSESQRKKISRLSFIYGSRKLFVIGLVLVIASLLTGIAIIQKTRDSNAASLQIIATATADTYISKPIPNQTLNKEKDLWTRGGNTRTSVSYIRFKVSGLGTNPVSSATLRLYHLDNPSPSGGKAYKIDWDWAYNPTWSKHPEIPQGSVPIGQIGNVDRPNSIYDMQLSTTGWKDGYVTIVLVSDVDDGVNYSSSQGVKAPQLVFVPTGATGGTTTPPTPTPSPTPSPTPTPTPTPVPPTPTSGSVFDEPFPNSVLRRPATGVAFDSNSDTYVNAILGAAAGSNSGRGPTIFSSGEQRYSSSASDPLWTFKGSGISTQIRAPQNITDSGGADPTIGIYDQSTGKVVRVYGGGSSPISFDRTNHIGTGTNMAVDTNGDGVPDQGKGTAWNRMSGEGLMIASDRTNLDHRIKFALGNNLLASSFRAPARAYETQSTGSTVPMGVTVCHLWTTAEVDAFQNAAGLTAAERTVSDSFTEGTSCSRGYGLVAGDGTGNGGFNLYLSSSELGLSEASVSKATRMPSGGNSGNPVSQFWKDKTKWRALVPG